MWWGTRPFLRCQGKVLISMPSPERISHLQYAVLPRDRSVMFSPAPFTLWRDGVPPWRDHLAARGTHVAFSGRRGQGRGASVRQRPFGDRHVARSCCLAPSGRCTLSIRLINARAETAQNMTIRIMRQKSTRLTKAVSEKLASLKAAPALHSSHYDFCRVHATLRIMRARAAGVTQKRHAFSFLRTMTA